MAGAPIDDPYAWGPSHGLLPMGLNRSSSERFSCTLCSTPQRADDVVIVHVSYATLSLGKHSGQVFCSSHTQE